MEPIDLTEDDFEGADGPLIFRSSQPRRSRGKWMIWAGLGFFCLAMGGFAFALTHRVDQLALHSMSTFPMIVAVGLLMAGLSLSRGPSRVTIDEEGFSVELNNETIRHAWADVGWVAVNLAGIGQQKTLVVYDRSGKLLNAFGEAFEDFDELVEVVKEKVAAHSSDVSQNIQSKKSRKSAFLVGGVGLLMLFAATAVAWMGYEEKRAGELLETQAIEGTAKIDRLFLAPNGYTTRLEYTITNEKGETGSRNAEIEPDYHARLEAENAKTIPVFFVPEEPGISRLKFGEVEDDDPTKTPTGSFLLAGGAVLVAIFLLVAAALQWFGWDFDLDSKTGKFSIKRFGERDRRQ